MRYPAIALAALVLGGCVTNPIYQWGGYESKLYAGYKDQTKMEELKLGLETHIAAMDKSGQKMAPGLYAELGTLYLQSGDSVKARGMYSRERDAWPESRGFMDAMISNLERQEAAHMEANK
jgi:hypothetical protein